MRIAIQLTMVSVLAVTLATISKAQPPYGNANPVAGPTYSPYLNLLRTGNSPGVNYYGLVKPEFEFRNAYRGLQQQVGVNQLNIAQMNDPRTGFPVTGHAAVFMNTGGYFMNSGAGASSGTGMGQKRTGASGMGMLGGGQSSQRGTTSGARQ